MRPLLMTVLGLMLVSPAWAQTPPPPASAMGADQLRAVIADDHGRVKDAKAEVRRLKAQQQDDRKGLDKAATSRNHDELAQARSRLAREQSQLKQHKQMLRDVKAAEGKRPPE